VLHSLQAEHAIDIDRLLRRIALRVQAIQSIIQSKRINILCVAIFRELIRGSDYSYTLLSSVVCLSLCLCLSSVMPHWCTLLKLLDGFACLLAATLVGSNVTHCVRWGPCPLGKGRFGGRIPISRVHRTVCMF